MPGESYRFLKIYLEQLELEFNKSDIKESLVSFSKSEYINYLSNYNNNLITFSSPTFIDVDLKQETFIKLFEKFIFRYQERRSTVQKQSINAKVKSLLLPKIKDNVNWNKKLTFKEIPDLPVPTQIDFIGRSDVPVAGQAIDFEKSTFDLSTKVSKLVMLKDTLDNTNKGKYFLIGEEPSKATFPEQHETWSHLTHSKLFEFVPLKETERIVEYINKHNVEPFVKE